jgi:glycerophosphoryl diester phosphodiesterase
MANQPLRIAHRGMPRLARENTLASFTLALDAGADGIELDVHATSDGVVVVHHDPILAGQAIAEESFVALHNSADPAGAAMPTLAEVCDLVEGRAELFVEVKGAAIERRVLDVLRHCNGTFAIHSFDHELIARIHALDHTLRLGVLFEELPADVPGLMATTGARDVWPHAPIISQQLVDEVHGAGGRVIAWTVNDVTMAKHLVSVGTDGLCGDDVRIFPAP